MDIILQHPTKWRNEIGYSKKYWLFHQAEVLDKFLIATYNHLLRNKEEL